jgi:hypothetical protein
MPDLTRPARWAALLAIIAFTPSRATPETNQGAQLLVIAPERFHAALRKFILHKRTLLPTELVALEKAIEPDLDETSVDEPERLKRFLYKSWKRGGARYALLVGDVDLLPVRYMVLDRVTPAAFDYAFYPSDLYYSDLAKSDGNFDDWNAAKHDFHARYFGEVRGEKNKRDPINFDQVDYRPDIAVGRWPVSTEDEVKRLARKTIAYEKDLLERSSVKQSAEALRQVGLFAVGGWVDSRGTLDKSADGLKKAGWTIHKRYYANPGQEPATPPPNESQVVALMRRGVPLLIHTGHGTDNSWQDCFSFGSLAKVKNANRRNVMVSIGCSTAHCAPLAPYAAYVDVDGNEHRGTDAGEVFTAPPPPPATYQTGKHNVTGLGEQLLRTAANGPIAYIGCNTGSQPCALTMLEGFLASAGQQPEPRLGDCWNDAIRHYYDHQRLADIKPDDGWYPPSIFFQGMKFMLLGDPTLRLPAPADFATEPLPKEAAL